MYIAQAQCTILYHFLKWRALFIKCSLMVHNFCKFSALSDARLTFSQLCHVEPDSCVPAPAPANQTTVLAASLSCPVPGEQTIDDSKIKVIQK